MNCLISIGVFSADPPLSRQLRLCVVPGVSVSWWFAVAVAVAVAVVVAVAVAVTVAVASALTVAVAFAVILQPC